MLGDPEQVLADAGIVRVELGRRRQAPPRRVAVLGVRRDGRRVGQERAAVLEPLVDMEPVPVGRRRPGRGASMSLGSRVRQAVRFVVHNWPLKLAAIALATLLYAGLVASQASSVCRAPLASICSCRLTLTSAATSCRVRSEIRICPPVV